MTERVQVIMAVILFVGVCIGFALYGTPAESHKE